jgi:hypothetical protein
MKKNFRFVLLLVLMVWLAGCGLKDPFGDDRPSRVTGNLPPETHLFLHVTQGQVTLSDTLLDGSIVTRLYTTGLDTTPSRQIIHWWGDDPDGAVTGYYYQWDYQAEPVFTTAEYDTFYVPIRSFYDEFSFKVWAVDNQGLQDPTPAQLRFPVFNTPPSIAFRLNSNPTITGNPNVTAYTFPTRTFVWDAADADGKETITHIFYALDDTSNWIALSGDADQITLTGIAPGEHRFFVKAMDVSGATSETISFPNPADSNLPLHWVVKAVSGEVLLVNDFAQDQSLYQVQGFYTQILDQLVGREGYSVWEIGSNAEPLINSQNALPYSSLDIEANLAYFRKVIWFAHLGRPHLTAAGLSITRFAGRGGNIFITNGNEETPDSTWTFTNLDSVYRLNPGGRLLAGIKVLASFGTPLDAQLSLRLEKLIGNRVSALIPGADAEVVLRMEPATEAAVTVPYKGSPPVGLRYPIGPGECIYFSLPLHLCNGNANMTEFFRYILFEEFN